jgi:hypothetical protein
LLLLVFGVGGSLSAVTTPTTQKGSHNHLVLLNGLSLIGKPMVKEKEKKKPKIILSA